VATTSFSWWGTPSHLSVLNSRQRLSVPYSHVCMFRMPRAGACRQIDVRDPLPQYPQNVLCVQSNGTAMAISGTQVKQLKDCLAVPTPACFLQLQNVLLDTGCIDCLPYLQNLHTRVDQYCAGRPEEDCVRTPAPCPTIDPIGTVTIFGFRAP
jgi:hypothetical protein